MKTEAGATKGLLAAERRRVLEAAETYLAEGPRCIPDVRAERSSGRPHDFFSESIYWWPNPDTPDGLPHVRRDGYSNPDYYVGHRDLVMRLGIQVGALASAQVVSGEQRFADKASEHLNAWFVDPRTRMTPSLAYAAAIPGRATGRSYGLIETVHLIEVALGAMTLADRSAMPARLCAGVREWFAQYHAWCRTHPFGVKERAEGNNHGTAWLLQAASYATLTDDQAALAEYRDDFKTRLLPDQMAADGSFPAELARTKPYGYSIFNLDLMAGLCQLLSTPDDDLWAFTTPDGRGMRRAMAFLYPYLKDKRAWPYAHDVMHWEDWPVRQPSLLFAGLAYDEAAYLELWRTLSANLKVIEVFRNMPIRHPPLWL